MDISSPLGPLFAFWAGLLSVLSPCVLPLVPVYITHLTGQTALAVAAGGVAADTGGPARVFAIRNNAAFPHALAFVGGFSVVFVVLGASVGVIGFALQDQQGLMERVAGVLVITMGLHIAGIITLPFLERTYEVDVGRGAPGLSRSFTLGSAFAVGWTPCIGPILGSILGLAATTATVWQGAGLLVFYAAGLSIPFLVAGAALGTATRLMRAASRYMPVITAASGLTLVVVGIIIFTGEMTAMNSYFDFFGTNVSV